MLAVQHPSHGNNMCLLGVAHVPLRPNMPGQQQCEAGAEVVGRAPTCLQQAPVRRQPNRAGAGSHTQPSCPPYPPAWKNRPSGARLPDRRRSSCGRGEMHMGREAVSMQMTRSAAMPVWLVLLAHWECERSAVACAISASRPHLPLVVVIGIARRVHGGNGLAVLISHRPQRHLPQLVPLARAAAACGRA